MLTYHMFRCHLFQVLMSWTLDRIKPSSWCSFKVELDNNPLNFSSPSSPTSNRIKKKGLGFQLMWWCQKRPWDTSPIDLFILELMMDWISSTCTHEMVLECRWILLFVAVFDPVKDPLEIVGNERHLHLLFRQFGKNRYEVSFIILQRKLGQNTVMHNRKKRDSRAIIESLVKSLGALHYTIAI